jgi:pheromone shutdown protein TraB
MNSNYFEEFKNSPSTQEKTKVLETICEELKSFAPKIKDALDQNRDLYPADKRKLNDLNNQYSSIMKDLNDEFKKHLK